MSPNILSCERGGRPDGKKRWGIANKGVMTMQLPYFLSILNRTATRYSCAKTELDGAKDQCNEIRMIFARFPRHNARRLRPHWPRVSTVVPKLGNWTILFSIFNSGDPRTRGIHTRYYYTVLQIPRGHFGDGKRIYTRIR